MGEHGLLSEQSVKYHELDFHNFYLVPGYRINAEQVCPLLLSFIAFPVCIFCLKEVPLFEIFFLPGNEN